MLKKNKQLIAKINCLEFENKRLVEALKTEKNERNKNKKLNLLGKENNGL